MEVRPDLRPFLDEVEIRCAERWLDADRDAARLVFPDTEAVIPELRPDLKAAGAGILAVRAQPPADAAAPDHPAWNVRWANRAAHSMLTVFAAAVLYTPAADQSVA